MARQNARVINEGHLRFPQETRAEVAVILTLRVEASESDGERKGQLINRRRTICQP
jgi:hypothetical protein